MTVSSDAFRVAVIERATAVAKGMLRDPDEDVVLADLTDFRQGSIRVDPSVLDAARSSMILARRTQMRFAEQALSERIAMTVAQLERQKPAMIEDARSLAEHGSIGAAASFLSIFIVSLAMAQALSGFEWAAKEYPRAPVERHDILGWVRGYLETVDESARLWRGMSSRTEPQGVTLDPLNAPHMSGVGIRSTFDVGLPGGIPFVFLDSRLVVDGDDGIVGSLTGTDGLAVAHLADGSFATWIRGRRSKAYSNLEAAMDEIFDVAGTS